MNKAILVIDMPESCDKCPLFHSFYTDMTCGANNCGIDYPYPKDFRQDWCPLKVMPHRKNSYTNVDESKDWYEIGYNQCLSDIMSK